MISRTSFTEVFEAASISITSTCRRSMIASQWRPCTGIATVGFAIEPSSVS